MKIAILVGGLPPQYNGGTEIATVNIARYAAKARHEVHVIAADGTGHADYPKLEDGFKVHRVETMEARYLHGITYIPQALAITLKLKPDLIHAQALYMTPTALIASRLGGIPYLFYERGGVRQKEWINGFAYKLVMRTAKRVIAQTESQKQALLEFHKREIEVIPNGIEIERFGKIGKLAARQELHLGFGKSIVLAVGRCRPEKNLGDFITAAKAQPKNQYVLCGDGEQLEELKRIAPQNVRFEGSVPNERIPVYMAAADVLLNTSKFEGFPNAFLEAMAAGLPIVAPRVTGIPEIVEHGINGILVGDTTNCATAVDWILTHKCEASFISATNRAKAKEYTWESVVKKLYV